MDITPDTPAPTHTPRHKWRRRLVALAWTLAASLAVMVTGALIHLPAHNPAYPATNAQVAAEIRRMQAEPVPLARPVVVVSGYRSPSGAASLLASNLRTLTGDDRVTHVGDPFADTIESLTRTLVAHVEAEYPSDDPASTTEVDVVAISMGGLVARLAADNPALRGEPAGKRLRIHTLYTLGSPHTGARLAAYVRPDRAARDMRPGSDFITDLNNRRAESKDTYPIVSYAILHDRLVGATHASPPGQDPIWVPGRVFFGHHLISTEKRIYADIALRLRTEAPLGAPSAPPCD